MTTLTQNFSLEELTHTDHREFTNEPNDLEKNNLRRLAELLEQVKQLLGGKPIMVNSAFRSKQVNDAVGSKDSSQHRIGCAADILSENLSDVVNLFGSTSLTPGSQNWLDTLAALAPSSTFGNVANYGYRPRGFSCTAGNTAGIALTSATAGNPIPANAIIDTVDLVTSEPVVSPAFIELPQANGYVQQAMNPAKPGKPVAVSYSRVSTANHVTFSVHKQIGGNFTIYWDYGKSVPVYCISAYCSSAVVFYPFISDITVTYELAANTGTSTLEASWEHVLKSINPS
jgi:hypothetical protein